MITIKKLIKESTTTIATSNMDKSEVVGKMLEILEMVCEKYNEHSSNITKSVPSAPNTASFRATQSGFIRMAGMVYKNDWSYSEKKYVKKVVSYGALQVGTLVPTEIRKEISNDIGNRLNQAFGSYLDSYDGGWFVLVDEGKEYPTRVFLDTVYGSNYISFMVK